MAAPRPTISVSTESQVARFTVVPVPSPPSSSSSSSSSPTPTPSETTYRSLSHRLVAGDHAYEVVDLEANDAGVPAAAAAAAAPTPRRWTPNDTFVTPQAGGSASGFRPASRPLRANQEAALRIIANRVADRMVDYEESQVGPALQHLTGEMLRYEGRLRAYRTDLANLSLRLATVENSNLERERKLQKLNLGLLAAAIVVLVVTVIFYIFKY